MTLRAIMVLAYLAVLVIMPAVAAGAEVRKACIPEGFVYAEESIPDLLLEIRYAGAHNFVG